MRKTLATMRDLELAMQDLYALYAVRFPEQREFWSDQAEQEAGHAEMIEQVLEQSMWQNVSVAGFDSEELEKDLQRLQKTISDLEQRSDLTAIEAIDIAVELEQNFSEVHSLKLVKDNLDPSISALVMQLQADDQRHVSAILALRDQI